MKKSIKALLIVLALGITYYIWVRVSGLAIPCIFRKITGWKCPGCGITTLIFCITRFDFSGAFQANPFLFLTGPVLLIELAYYYWNQAKGKVVPKWNQCLLIMYTIALCIFGVWRNIK